MASSLLIRLGGLAAVVGGVVYVGLILLAGPYWIEYLYYANTIGYGFVAVLFPLGAMASIVALYALQGRRYGIAGTLGSSVALAGLALVVGALTAGALVLSYPSESLLLVILAGLLLASVGIVLLGGLTIAMGELPRWCGVALMAGSPFGMVLMMMPAAYFAAYILRNSPKEAFWLTAAGEALGGAAWVLVGYAVFRAAGRRSDRPSRVQ